MPETKTFDDILEMVQKGAAAAAALLPFLVAAAAQYNQVIAAWRALGLDDEQIRAHIAESEVKLDVLAQWAATYEPAKHPDSRL